MNAAQFYGKYSVPRAVLLLEKETKLFVLYQQKKGKCSSETSVFTFLGKTQQYM